MSMEPLTSFLIRTLNENFRPPGHTCPAFFPSHEFNEDEAAQLAQFCDRIASEGYDFIFAEQNAKQLRDVLDLAAEYGCFVDASAGPWYLGVFIIAEIVMEPYASDSFAGEMYRSEVFRTAPKSAQEFATFLMLMAIVCDRPNTAAMRLANAIEGATKAKSPLSHLSLDQVLIRLCPQSQTHA